MAAFVLLIVGMPLMAFMPWEKLPLPLIVGQILATALYGAIAVFFGVVGFMVTGGVVSIVYHRVAGVSVDQDAKGPSIMVLIWWFWLAALSWMAVVGFAMRILDVWVTGGG
ncbi:hypothetical protein HED60_24295 [Planctomycetales bacterium ZRK34]|nr:hypothetical protein HED60_24295 [Planctomycetales bacterium ZRK34]